MDEAARVESLLLSCCLMPTSHLSTLVYLLKFFADVAAHSTSNKMDQSNLAIVLTPTFFPMSSDANVNAADKKASEQLAKKTEIVEALFHHQPQVHPSTIVVCILFSPELLFRLAIWLQLSMKLIPTQSVYLQWPLILRTTWTRMMTLPLPVRVQWHEEGAERKGEAAPYRE